MAKETLLDVSEIAKFFGGVRAVNKVSLEVKRGELVSIIGPNGSGKTTLFHLITGYYQPNLGKVLYLGKDITGLSPHVIFRQGLVRSFQIANIFRRFTVYESVQFSVLARLGKTGNFVWPVRNVAVEEVLATLDRVGLLEQVNYLSGELPLGDQKRLELAMALASKPKLLLLDEPTAGMSPVEKQVVVELIRSIVQEFDITCLMIEHDVSVVRSIASRVVVMNKGRTLAEGTPEEISRKEIVRQVYLGEVE
jgi:branched-chain amino acid transport system ATP-binding protein